MLLILIFQSRITINRLFKSIEIQELHYCEHEIVVDFEVVDSVIKLYVMISKWNFDKIESFYKESKIKAMLKPSSIDRLCDMSWLDLFFKYYNDKKEELTSNLSIRDRGKLHSLQNDIYGAIEKIIFFYSNDYFRNRNILETKTIQACVQTWNGKLEESDIARGTGIENQTVHSIVKSLINDGIVQEQENGRLSCVKRKFSDDAVRAMRERARKIAQ